MSRFLRPLRRAAICLAAGAFAAAGASEAAPVKLRYDFFAVITGTSYTHMCYRDYATCPSADDPYPAIYLGPALGTHGPASLTVELGEDYLDEWGEYDVRFDYSILGLPRFSSSALVPVADFDPVTKAIRLFSNRDLLDFFEISIPAPDDDWGGRGYVDWEQDGGGSDRARMEFELFDVRVADLAAIAPVPLPVPLPATLPATLPLLAGGVAGLAWRRRRRPQAAPA